MRSNRWEHLNSREIKSLAEKQAIVLIPLGAIEQHGPHLAVGCDALMATWFSDRAAQGLEARGIPTVVAPTISVANSKHHMSFPGTISLNPSTFLPYLTEYCQSIAAHGFRRIVIVNGHGGNRHPVQTALIEINEKLGFPVFFTSYFNGVEETQYLERQNGMIHACESETSLMLAYDERLVDPIYRSTSGNPGACTDAEARGDIATFRRMETHTENGVMGEAFAATKEKGERLAQAFTQRLVETLSDARIWDSFAPTTP
ncbi:MAG: creatininase family protein [Bacillota bacterium]|nr:creatininase family protein [Bacillota bacterium]